MHGGKECIGSDAMTQTCQDRVCPGMWVTVYEVVSS